jgi:glycosyltransferase involved in cell wall biosynthesis
LLQLNHLSAVKSTQEAATATGRRRWLYEREAARERHLETWAAQTFDGLIVVSEEDAAVLRRLAPGAGPLIVAPNGVDVDRFIATPVPIEPSVLLSASLDYPPNAEGARWFCAEVLPIVQRAVPGLRFRIVGRKPGPDTLALARPGVVEVCADVPSMVPYLRQSRVAVVPLRVGTGTRLKALEAMAAGRPVVGTSIGLEGLGIIDGVHARIADTPAAMAAAIIELLTVEAKAQNLAAGGRKLVEDRFRWDAIGNALAADLGYVAARPGRSRPPAPNR